MQVLKVRFTQPQLTSVHAIVTSYRLVTPKPSKMFSSTVLEDALTKRLAVIALTISDARSQSSETALARSEHYYSFILFTFCKKKV